jgi:acyl-coenzyme A thioesterase PaaI-like protein
VGDGSPRFLVTVKLSVRYRRPVPVGAVLTVRGRAGKDNGRVAYATGEIFDEQGTLLAESEAVLADLPPDVSHEPPDGDDWKVYPD